MAASDAALADSVEIGLVTCSPHNEIYSLYGHTALRYHDLRTGEDCMFNYGVFNYQAPHFVLRFIFGLTDYELGIVPTRPFLQYYRKWGSSVTEQVINLTPEEKMAVIDALNENYRPENRVYRYNYFYDNCSIRPRNLIERCLSGRINYPDAAESNNTYRQLIHQRTDGHPWAAFGNDLLLGVKADIPVARREQQFLPGILQTDFAQATITDGNGTRPLVKETRLLVPPGVQKTLEDHLPTPFVSAILLLTLSVVVFFAEHIKKSTFRAFDVVLMAASGLAGCLLLCMIFSQHPTTSLNLQILVLNPAALCFIPAVVRKRKTRWFAIQAICIILFFIGSFFQDYADGMEIVASCLLLRSLRHLYDK